MLPRRLCLHAWPPLLPAAACVMHFAGGLHHGSVSSKQTHLKTQFAADVLAQQFFGEIGSVDAGRDSVLWELLQSDLVVSVLGQSLLSGCAEQSPPPAAASLPRSLQELRCGWPGFLGVENFLWLQRWGDFSAKAAVLDSGEIVGSC